MVFGKLATSSASTVKTVHEILTKYPSSGVWEASMITAHDVQVWNWRKASRILSFAVGGTLAGGVHGGDRAEYFWLRKIESFVSFVLADRQAVIRTVNVGSGRPVLQSSPLIDHFRVISKFWCNLIPGNCNYSCEVELFLACWDKCCGRSEYLDLRGYAIQHGKASHDFFNDLIAEIRSGAAKPAFRTAVRKRDKEGDKNYRRVEGYVQSLYARYPYARTYVVDFLCEADPGRPPMIGDIQRALKRLINNRRRNLTLFDRQVGYVWTLHWLINVGWCASVAFFLADAYGLDEQTIAHEFGSYWNTAITKGRGRYVVVKNWPGFIDPQAKLHEVQEAACEEVLKELRHMIFARMYMPIPMHVVPPAHTKWFGVGGGAYRNSP